MADNLEKRVYDWIADVSDRLGADRVGNILGGAMVGAARGYKVKLFLPDNASPERKLILRAFGAELVLTNPLEGTDGASGAPVRAAAVTSLIGLRDPKVGERVRRWISSEEDPLVRRAYERALP